MNKFPIHNKVVFEGQIFKIHQWEQELFDGSFTSFEGISRAPSVQILVVTQDKKLAILEEEQPPSRHFFGLCGGQVEENEEPLECAQRELLEELGMQTQDWELYKIVENPNSKIDWDTYYFIAKNCSKTVEQTLDAGEKIKAHFLSFEDFCEKVDDENFRNEYFAEDLFRLRKDKTRMEEFEEFKKRLLQ